jgi:hypothetical protein
VVFYVRALGHGDRPSQYEHFRVRVSAQHT